MDGGRLTRERRKVAMRNNLPSQLELNLKRRAPVNTSSAPAFSSAEVVIEVDDFIAAIYRDNGRVYMGKVTDVDESDAFVSFLEHRGEMSNKTTFVKAKSPDEVWVRRRDVLCVIPEPSSGYSGKIHRFTLEKHVLDEILRCYCQWEQ